ncbi:MAG: hypothetical protein ACYTF9_14990, partial [Planctomycetota bacterium]
RDYVREHVRLGYATTEHGIQGDTVSVGAELASEATTRRGLYVGATRGRDENLILVITESHDIAEALDVLERVLANNRADLPAIAQRRELAAAARMPRGQDRPEPPKRRTVSSSWSTQNSPNGWTERSNGEPTPAGSSTPTGQLWRRRTRTSRLRGNTCGRRTRGSPRRERYSGAAPVTTSPTPRPTSTQRSNANSKQSSPPNQRTRRSPQPTPKCAD